LYLAVEDLKRNSALGLNGEEFPLTSYHGHKIAANTESAIDVKDSAGKACQNCIAEKAKGEYCCDDRNGDQRMDVRDQKRLEGRKLVNLRNYLFLKRRRTRRRRRSCRGGIRRTWIFAKALRKGLDVFGLYAREWLEYRWGLVSASYHVDLKVFTERRRSIG